MISRERGGAQPQMFNLNNTNMTDKEIIESITKSVMEQCTIGAKDVLTSEEAAKYMGVSMSYLYKLTAEQRVPHYKPNGKIMYFNRRELEQWLQSNRIATMDEIAAKAQGYCNRREML
jgi:DNA binding domain, excisionase family